MGEPSVCSRGLVPTPKMVHCEVSSTETRDGKSDLALWKWTLLPVKHQEGKGDVICPSAGFRRWLMSFSLSLSKPHGPAFEQHLLQAPVNQLYSVDAKDSEHTLCARSELLVEHSSVSHEGSIFHISSLCSWQRPFYDSRDCVRCFYENC